MADVPSCVVKHVTPSEMEKFIAPDGCHDAPLMFRRCTDATEHVVELLSKPLKDLSVKIVIGRWTGDLSDRYRKAAVKTGILTQKNKRNHQWIAVGKKADISTRDALLDWYNSAVVFDPTHVQFTLESNEGWKWDPNTCFNVANNLQLSPETTVKHWNRFEDIETQEDGWDSPYDGDIKDIQDIEIPWGDEEPPCRLQDS